MTGDTVAIVGPTTSAEEKAGRLVIHPPPKLHRSLVFLDYR